MTNETETAKLITKAAELCVSVNPHLAPVFDARLPVLTGKRIIKTMIKLIERKVDNDGFISDFDFDLVTFCERVIAAT